MSPLLRGDREAGTALTAEEKGSTMTDQNQPPVPPSEPNTPATPDFEAPAAPAAPAFDAPAAPAAPTAPAAPAYEAPAAPAYTPPAAPAYAAPAYGAPAAGYGQAATQKTNTFAIISLVASIAGWITGITFIVGIIFGHISLGQIKKTGENGRGMAIAGLVVGYVGIALTIIGIIIFIAVLATFPAAINTYDY